MIVQVAPQARDEILRAMAAVATGGGRYPLSDIDAVTIAVAARVVFGAEQQVDVVNLTPIEPQQLGAALAGSGPAASDVAHFLAVMALVDGVVDAARLTAAQRFVAALGVREDFVADLSEAASGHLAWVVADLNRQNVVSISHGQARTADEVQIWPYRAGGGDRVLVGRYQALAQLPPGTLGHEFFEWYRTHHFALPGEPDAVNERFVQPHDSIHLLSGYSTSPQGELLVSTFTAGAMHQPDAFAAHILPVLFSFHLGIRLNNLAGAWRGSFDAEKFWTAWDRGAACTANLFAADWDFWAVADVPLPELRRRHRVPVFEPRLAASDAGAVPA